MAETRSTAFERLARDYLAAFPQLVHEWRHVPSRFWGDRVDLILRPPSDDSLEVWATLSDGQLTVGAGDSHEDFETFGRRLTDAQVAEEAFARFVTLLRDHGYLAE